MEDNTKILIDFMRPEILDELPLHVLLTEEAPMPDTATRLAPSDTHQAEGYLCEPFYKPISRCVG